MRHAALRWCGAVAIGAITSWVVAVFVDARMVGPDFSNRKVYVIVGASVCAALITTPLVLWLMWRGVRVTRPIAWSIAGAVTAMVIGTVCIVCVVTMGVAVPNGG